VELNNAVCRLGDLGYIEPGSHAHKYESIGCSRVADILGCGYRTPSELWQQMTHRAPDEGHKRIFDRGHAMEAHGAQMIQRDHGRVLVAEQVQYRDPARPWLIYHADGMFPTWTPLNEGGVEREGPGIWEFKAPGTEMADKMRRDGMSQSYICQGQAGMYVASVALQRAVNWATYGFIDYNAWELVAFDMAALPQFQRDALQLIDRFWDCVVRDTPPTDINQNEVPQIPVVSGALVEFTDGELPVLAKRLLEIGPDLDLLKKENDYIREQMKEILDGCEVAEVPGLMKFSYKYGKPGETIDGAGLLEYCGHVVECYNDLIAAVRNQVDVRNITAPSALTFRRSDFVTPKAPTRTFRPTPVKG
jgi:hypothetical protein